MFWFCSDGCSDDVFVMWEQMLFVVLCRVMLCLRNGHARQMQYPRMSSWITILCRTDAEMLCRVMLCGRFEFLANLDTFPSPRLSHTDRPAGSVLACCRIHLPRPGAGVHLGEKGWEQNRRNKGGAKWKILEDGGRW